MVNYLIIFNLLFFVATILSGGFNLANLLRLGAKFGPLIAAGEWQRLLLATFLHGNFWHLFFNLYALYYLGNLAERVFNPRKFFAIYLLSGLSGSVFSTIFHFTQVGVGASGAIFGLAGAIFASGIKHRDTPLNRLGTSLLPFIVINLLIGFLGPTIDNAAHIGGLLVGMLLGWLLSPGTSWFRWKRIAEEVATWALIGFVAISMLSFFVPAFGQPSVERVVSFHNGVQRIFQRIERGSIPSSQELDALSPPDREAREIRDLLSQFAQSQGRDTSSLREAESKFLDWREKILEKYQGLIYESP